MPHGLVDGLGQSIRPTLLVNTSSVHKVKRQALGAHRSQKDWLDKTQGLDSYLSTMDEMSADVARFGAGFDHAEGWRMHSHLGFCAAEYNPIQEELGTLCVSKQARRL
jgi:LmbE family N-acetylglucosaminyl deacetylase